MAEGGFEFDNPVFDNDDDDEEENTFQNDEEQQSIINREIEVSEDLSENDSKTHEGKAIRTMIKHFYDKNKETLNVNYEKNFFIKKDEIGRPLLYVKDDFGSEYQLSKYNSDKPYAVLNYYSFSTLMVKYRQ